MLWLPDVSPATLLLDPAPPGFQDAVAIDPTRLGPVAADIADGTEREVVILDGQDELHIRLRTPQSVERPAVLLPVDSMFELRLEVALRFVQRMRGKRAKLLPSALRLTAMQKTRLVRLLHTFDIRDAGGGPRDVAFEVLDSKQAQLPAIEWKDSHARRAANRLIHDALALVERDYLKLLRGR
ncbi:DUF2285 domain-containing protein [Bradyrhizobium sp. USDA 4473]